VNAPIIAIAICAVVAVLALGDALRSGRRTTAQRSRTHERAAP
jgi:hypothetical protein